MRKLRTMTGFVLGILAISSAGSIGRVRAGEKKGFPLPTHVDQHTIRQHSFEEVYEWGNKIFHAQHNSLDGVGMNLNLDPPGELVSIRFVRSPRPDLPVWSRNPRRPDGPQSQSCSECHTASGRNTNAMNEQRDPLRTRDARFWIARQPTDLHGVGGLQLIAEQTSRELARIAQDAIAAAVSQGSPVTVDFTSSNGVNYGRLTARPDGTLDKSEVVGISREDFPINLARGLAVQPFHLKAIVNSIRFFVAGAGDVTLGLQSPEREAEFDDTDFDGVTGEWSTGDVTAMTLYLAGLQRPVTKLELHHNLGGRFRLTRSEIASIQRGESQFSQMGCTSCHKPVMNLADPTFREPSSTPGFNFTQFWINRIDPGPPPRIVGTDPLPYGYDPANPFTFDLTRNPVVEKTCRDLGRDAGEHSRRPCFLQYESNGHGGARLRMYGDQKRHEMGPGLAEAIDEFNIGPSVWRTKELWGVGSTGPWLHDGRATTLTEAILFHGGEAEESRMRFSNLDESAKDDVIAFLQNLILFTPPDGRRDN